MGKNFETLHPLKKIEKKTSIVLFTFFWGYYTCITHASTRPCDPTSSLQLRAAPEPLESGESGWKVVQPEDFPKIWSDWNQIDIDHWSDFYWIVRSCFHGNSMDDSALTPSNMQDPRQWWPGNGAKWSLIRLIPTSQIIVVPSKLLSFLQLDVRTTTQIQVFQWRSLNGVVFLTSIDFQIHFKSLFCTSFPRHFPCAPSNPPLRTQPSAGCGEA